MSLSRLAPFQAPFLAQNGAKNGFAPFRETFFVPFASVGKRAERKEKGGNAVKATRRVRVKLPHRPSVASPRSHRRGRGERRGALLARDHRGVPPCTRAPSLNWNERSSYSAFLCDLCGRAPEFRPRRSRRRVDPGRHRASHRPRPGLHAPGRLAGPVPEHRPRRRARPGRQRIAGPPASRPLHRPDRHDPQRPSRTPRLGRPERPLDVERAGGHSLLMLFAGCANLPRTARVVYKSNAEHLACISIQEAEAIRHV